MTTKTKDRLGRRLAQAVIDGTSGKLRRYMPEIRWLGNHATREQLEQAIANNLGYVQVQRLVRNDRVAVPIEQELQALCHRHFASLPADRNLRRACLRELITLLCASKISDPLDCDKQVQEIGCGEHDRGPLRDEQLPSRIWSRGLIIRAERMLTTERLHAWPNAKRILLELSREELKSE